MMKLILGGSYIYTLRFYCVFNIYHKNLNLLTLYVDTDCCGYLVFISNCFLDGLFSFLQRLLQNF